MHKLKRTTEEVARYFEEQGCKLLGEYKGALAPMDYQCKCGKLSKISWNNFSNGRRCGYCHSTGRKKKYSRDEVAEIFKSRGCELLETTYSSNKQRLRYRCKCGRVAKISFVGFYFQKQYCRACGTEETKKKLRKEGSQEYRKVYYKYRKSLRRTLKALKQEKMDYSHRLLGYTAKDLQQHIINHPNWEKVKDATWHLDHIFPVRAFVEHGITDIKLINCLENLQPLFEKDNISKNDDYDKHRFKTWLTSH
jgi:hypothetical protein